MPFTDTSESGFQRHLTDQLIQQHGYIRTQPHDFDLDYLVNREDLFAFIEATQPDTHTYLTNGNERSFLARLHKQLAKKGVIHVLRKGVKYNDKTVQLFYPQPASSKNPEARAHYAANTFTVTEELIYSKQHHRELDVVIFINGIPLITMELKNPQTGQYVANAIKQYRDDRSPQDDLLNFGRCLVHFAADTSEIYMTTQLADEKTRFLPFNRGQNAGEPHPPFGQGNPPNPDGIKTSYLWEDILAKDTLSLVLDKFAQLVEERDPQTNKKKRFQIFPRFHQLDAVRELIAHSREQGAGQRYLIQHSTGSGKSFSIVWLTFQLANLFDQAGEENIFDSVIVVTDRRNLDEQIKEQLKSFTSVKNLVAMIDDSSGSKSQQLAEALHEQKKIIVVTVQTFPFVLDHLRQLENANYAIVIDEAHSGQSGMTAAQMNAVLSNEEVETLQSQSEDGTVQTEDFINSLIRSRRMLSNASYYAFTATPKNKTLETFGTAAEDGKFYPYHLYPMKQAIEEGFIIDVLQNYTTYTSYYKLAKAVEENPEFDVKRANRDLRVFVESHPSTVEKKAKLMVDHFHNDVAHRIEGKARAMVVTRNIHAAMQYKDAFDAYLQKINSPYKSIVAFSGTKKHYQTGEELTEAKMNRFEDGVNDIPMQLKRDPYRFLIVAEKYQTGFDEPLLHTMYVDKRLAGLQAVQTLSRLNRSHPQKEDTFVLDFYNEADDIQKAFAPYYTATVLSEKTDPNKLNDLQSDLEEAQVYTPEDVDRYFASLSGGASRAMLESQLDGMVAVFENLPLEAQIEWKAKAKSFVRTYSYISKLIDFENSDWEKLYWLLRGLVPKLRVQGDEDEEESVVKHVDIGSFRPSRTGKHKIVFDGDSAEVEPVPTEGGSMQPQAKEKKPLDEILGEFNARFGNVDWNEPDEVKKTLIEEIPEKLKDDEKLRKTILNSDWQNAKQQTESELGKLIGSLAKSRIEIYKQFSQDGDFQQKYKDFIFEIVWEAVRGREDSGE